MMPEANLRRRARFLDQHDVLLLDMNGTFMFGHDRFGPDEDYFGTYTALGGYRLDRAALLAVLRPSLEALLAMYHDPTRFEDFPSLEEAFRMQGTAEEAELPILLQLFATHELGRIPPAHRDFIQSVAATHVLGVVSNLCAHPRDWLASHPDAEVFAHFRTLVFSSEGRTIKPSPRLFQRALDTLPPGAAVVFAGDSLERDIIPAKALGLTTVWIAPPGSAHPAADRVVTTLPELATLPVERGA